MNPNRGFIDVHALSVGQINQIWIKSDPIKMNPNRIESNINTEWVLFYGISDYEFYPNPN